MLFSLMMSAVCLPQIGDWRLELETNLREVSQSQKTSTETQTRRLIASLKNLKAVVSRGLLCDCEIFTNPPASSIGDTTAHMTSVRMLAIKLEKNDLLA